MAVHYGPHNGPYLFQGWKLIFLCPCHLPYYILRWPCLSAPMILVERGPVYSGQDQRRPSIVDSPLRTEVTSMISSSIPQWSVPLSHPPLWTVVTGHPPDLGYATLSQLSWSRPRCTAHHCTMAPWHHGTMSHARWLSSELTACRLLSVLCVLWHGAAMTQGTRAIDPLTSGQWSQ